MEVWTFEAGMTLYCNIVHHTVLYCTVTFGGTAACGGIVLCNVYCTNLYYTLLY